MDDLTKAMGDAFDLLDAAIMDIDDNLLIAHQRAAFDKAYAAKNALENGLAILDEIKLASN